MNFALRVARGDRIRQYRLRLIRDDGNPWKQIDLGRAAGVSEKTIARVEAGESVRPATLAAILQALQLDHDERRDLEALFNAFAAPDPRLDDAERWKIRERVRLLMRSLVPPMPAYVADEFWFMRAVNIYILTIHRIEPRALRCPEMWHNLAVKFHPAGGVKTARGPGWRDMYLAAMTTFRSEISAWAYTERYERTLAWLTTLPDFQVWWRRAGRKLARQPMTPIERIVAPTGIPVQVPAGLQLWNDIGGHVYISSALPAWRRSTWMLAKSPGETSQQALSRLAETAEELGYRLDNPILYIEDYLDEAKLREIGGYLL